MYIPFISNLQYEIKIIENYMCIYIIFFLYIRMSSRKEQNIHYTRAHERYMNDIVIRICL